MKKLIFNKKLICLLLLLLAVLFVYKCFDNDISESELYGTYIAKHSFGEVRLVLNSDGTFVQKATIKTAKEPILQEGKWEYNYKKKTYEPDWCTGCYGWYWRIA